MAFLKYGNAVVTTPVVAPEKWIDKKVSPGRVKVAKKVVANFDPSKWLLSHATIIASVDTDFADPNDKKSNYLIQPEYSIFVNNNGDSWERELLKACYKTFLGVDNYCEHVQIPELSKGKVIDLALREIPFAKRNGKDLTTLYVDILLATNRKHEDLIQKIEAGEYSALSMGCLIKYSQCSQCGNIAEDDSQACKHVRFFKNNYFYDLGGVRRIIAELCGRAEEPDSCKFIDASWVRKPAFEGAVLRNILQIGSDNQDVSEKIKGVIGMPSFEPQEGMFLKAANEAASDLVRKVAGKEEAPASEAPPPDTTNFPEPSGGETPPLTTDSPPAEGEGAPEAPSEGTEETPPAGGAGGAEGAPGGSAPTPEVEEPLSDATVKEVKDMLKKEVLNEIRKDLLQQKAKEEQGQRPAELENESNDSLLHTASEAIIKEAIFKKIVSSARRFNNDKLLNGVHILSNLKSWKDIKKYGYTRSDVLGLLHLIDRTIAKQPVGSDAVKAMSRIKLSSNNLQGFFTEMIVEVGRKPSASEAKKLARWGRILSNFD